MVFSSLTFLYFFLPLTLAATFLVPARHRNGVALAASLLFFAWGAPRFVFILVAGCLLDYGIGGRLASGGVPDARRRRRWLGLGIAVNLALLLYFKYANFGMDQINAALELAGATSRPWHRVALPIGISFFTFQKISYLMDVHRGCAAPAKSFGRYLLYITLFPQLIAGPIVRYHDVDRQIDNRNVTLELFLDGWWRLAAGLAKKCLLANPLAILADQAFAAAPGTLGAGAAWIGLVAYALQIYFDFSGYSDMAIGLGRMLGFQFLENFNFPYVSRGMVEFWRRWHISLGNFMREYLYIPLGGNRVSPAHRAFNLWLVFLLSGFWHGAAWNFVIWGAWHGLWITIEKRLAGRLKPRVIPAAIGIPITFLLVLLGWVFFRAETLPAAWSYLQMLAGAGATATHPLPALQDARTVTALIAGSGLAFAPLFLGAGLSQDWRVENTARHAGLRVLLRTAVTLALVGLSTLPLLRGGFNPFIYFRF